MLAECFVFFAGYLAHVIKGMYASAIPIYDNSNWSSLHTINNLQNTPSILIYMKRTPSSRGAPRHLKVF